MTALTTESRTTLAAAFTGQGYRVYDTPPPVPTPPCVTFVADSPWIRPSRIGSHLNYEVRWRILVAIKVRKTSAELLDIEDAVDTILGLIPAGFEVAQVGPPQLTDIGAQGTVITTEIAVSAHMKE